MNGRRLRTALMMTARETLRGRFVLLLLLVVPSIFYLVAWLTGTDELVPFQLASIGEGVTVTAGKGDLTALFIGLAATGLLTAFVGLKLTQREVEANRRLILCGYRASELLLARLVVLLGMVAAVSAWVTVLLPVLFFSPERPLLVWLGFAVAGFVYGCWGLLVGALVRRELEGVLFVALLTNLDAGWLQNPIWYADAENQIVIRTLPMHYPSQAAMAAAFGTEPVIVPLLAGSLYGAALLVLALGLYGWRMGRH